MNRTETIKWLETKLAECKAKKAKYYSGYNQGGAKGDRNAVEIDIMERRLKHLRTEEDHYYKGVYLESNGTGHYRMMNAIGIFYDMEQVKADIDKLPENILAKLQEASK